MPPQPPDYGYGPANYSDQGGGDPFSAFDNRIRYQDMLRYQMVSQYQQSVVRPSTMTLSQARQVATQPRFQYGVQGGQDPRFYERQASLSRMAYGASLAGGMADIGTWGVMEAGVAATGMKLLGSTTAASLALPLAAAVLPMMALNKGIQNSLERRKYMHGIAADVEQYRDRLGFSGGLSYSQATELGRNLQESMYKPGQFFSKEQQMNIHKIGLSNDLISAQGSSSTKGTIGQYKKNFEELKQTTEEVVKLLQTTVEGGMSVIKELQQKGFGNIQQIKQQVMQAKVLGGFTGMGAQNMMQLGAAGAQAVQGTPWKASVGASMYQLGAAEASTLARSGRAGAYAVERVGGTAAAGAAIGNFAMNMMQSGIGTKLAAYAMKGDGSVDPDRMSRMLSGRAGAYEIVTGANNAGYSMGENRVRFQMFKEDMLNQMSDKERMQMVTAGFNAWSKQRPYSSLKNRAYVFAGQFTNDPRQQRLVYENLMTIKDYGGMAARSSVERALINESPGRSVGLRRGFEDIKTEFNRGINTISESITSAAIGKMDEASDLWGGFKGVVAGGVDTALKGAGFGGLDRSNYADMRSSYENLYGLGSAKNIEAAGVDRASLKDVEIVNPIGNMNMQALMKQWKKAGNYERNIQKLGTIAGSGDWGQLLKDPRFAFNESQRGIINTNPQAAGLGMFNKLGEHVESIHSKYEAAVGAVNTSENIKNRSSKQVQIDRLWIERIQSSIRDGNALKIDPEMKASSFKRKKATYESKMIDEVMYTKGGAFKTGGKVSVRGEMITEAGDYMGLKGVSKEVGEYGMAELAKAGMGELTPEFIEHLKIAGKIKTDTDYSGILGVKTGISPLAGRSKKEWDRLKSLKKEFGDSFNFKTKEGQQDFAKAVFDARSGTEGSNRNLLLGAEGILTEKGVQDLVQKEAQRTLAGNMQLAQRRTINDMKIARETEAYGKLTEGDKGVFKKLIGKAYSGLLDDKEFKILKQDKFKDVSEATFSGPIREVSTASEFKNALLTKAVDKEKNSSGSYIQEMKEELKKLRMVESGELKGKVEVKTFDGSDKVEVIEKAGFLDDGSVRRGKAGRIAREFEQKIKDEQMYKSNTQTNTMNAIVKPPVLNYWNNRWTL